MAWSDGADIQMFSKLNYQVYVIKRLIDTRLKTGTSTMVQNTADAGSEYSLRRCVRTAWAVIQSHWFSLVSAAFLRDLISLLAAGLVFVVLIDWKGWNLVAACVVRCLAWSAVQCGYLQFCLNICDKNVVQWKDLFCGIRFSLQMLIATACLWMGVALGLIILIIPGVFVAVRCSLYGFAMVHQKLGPLSSLLRSHRMLTGYGKMAGGLLLIYFLGASIFGLWFYAFEAFMNISLCTLYKHIREQEATI
jgi:hypothetical protein